MVGRRRASKFVFHTHCAEILGTSIVADEGDEQKESARTSVQFVLMCWRSMTLLQKGVLSSSTQIPTSFVEMAPAPHQLVYVKPSQI